MSDIVLSIQDGSASVGFLGGHPLVPKGFSPPRSGINGIEQRFMFQLFFPEWHDLSGNCLLFFFDPNNIDEHHVIPDMSTPDNYPKIVDRGVLEKQQRYHSIFIFSAQDLIVDPQIVSPLVRKNMSLVEKSEPGDRFGRLNRSPVWLLGDETPPPSTRLPTFVFQISENYLFERHPTSSPQRQIDYFSSTGVSDRNTDNYKIFVGNEIYIFAYADLIQFGAFVCVQNSE
ncbi:hypothetical protein [Methylobacterium sp. Leaf469]|uniref:hypothetical protein n=1 Tax=Methylobacterium sp. Leaf469 TaxID=1736387 RepID=UPI000B1FF5C7|nr:hypothetical protein [Methylobacterium sp. Leaf469]